MFHWLVKYIDFPLFRDYSHAENLVEYLMDGKLPDENVSVVESFFKEVKVLTDHTRKVHNTTFKTLVKELASSLFDKFNALAARHSDNNEALESVNNALALMRAVEDSNF